MLSVLAVGDVHAGKNNLAHVKMLMKMLKRYLSDAKEHNELPDVLVFMGDLFDRFENLNLYALKMVTKNILAFSRYLYVVVLVGNHDRGNPEDFQSSIHPFTGLMNRTNISIVDKAKHVLFRMHNTEEKHRLVFVPYVPPGRFREALDTLKVSIEEYPPSAIFCHQEFYDVSLGGVKRSTHGDKWPEDAPFVFSGHIHHYHYLQSNILYVGTPYQITHAESPDKGILAIRIDPNDTKHPHVKRIPLGITHKMIKRLAQDEVEAFVAENASTIQNKEQVKVFLYGTDPILLHEAGFTNVEVRPPRQTLDEASIAFKQTQPNETLQNIWFSLLKNDAAAMTLATTICGK